MAPGDGFPRGAWGLSAGHRRAGSGIALGAALSLACGGATTSGSKAAAPASTISPLPRSVRVEPDTVVVEGRWFPVEAGPESPVPPNAVRVVCARVRRTCDEDLTRLADEHGAEPVHAAFEYRIQEWTKWGTPAGKLVAFRQEGGAQVEIRVSLSGLAAEKVVTDKGSETRWRVE